MSLERHAFHLSIGSRFDNIDLVQVVLNEALEGLGFGEDDRHWIDLAVREAVANAIQHGNREDPTKTVQVDFGLEEEEAVIRVRDEGEGFDPATLADPLAKENLLQPGGRGLLYIRSFMDGVEMRVHPQGGTEVTLRKRIPAPARGTSQSLEEKHS